MWTTARPRLLVLFVALFLATLVPLGPPAALTAQGSAAPVRLRSASPGALMVNPAKGTTRIRLFGEHVNAGDVSWTWRLFRYYVRRSGEAEWRRLYLNPQGSWYESAEDLAPLQTNGWNSRWGGDFMEFELPNDVYFRAPGALEFRVERGEWHERQHGSGDDARFSASFEVETRSNVLEVPIRPAPTAAPTVTGVDPAHVPVLNRGDEPAVIRVRVESLMPGADARVGTQSCEIVELHAAAGYLECQVPTSLQSEPGMYLVGVTTARGGPRRLARLHVQAPLELDRPTPLRLPVADSAARLRFSYRGGTPLRARLRSADGWESVPVAAAGNGAVTVQVPAGLARRAGTLEVELANAAGAVRSTIPVCGGAGVQPEGCAVLNARPTAVRARGVTRAAPPTPTQRKPMLIDPTNAVSLRPQPEPPGLTRVNLAARASLRLADGHAVAWRRIEGTTRLVLLDGDGDTAHVFAPGATLARGPDGALYVRVRQGVLALGRAAPRQP